MTLFFYYYFFLILIVFLLLMVNKVVYYYLDTVGSAYIADHCQHFRTIFTARVMVLNGMDVINVMEN